MQQGKKIYGLLGASLAHSFSASYFSKKFADLGLTDCEYRNFELASLHGFAQLLRDEPGLLGLNVTYPYKEAVLPLLDEITPEAKAVGAVNCIRISGGKTTGYNTDVYGFSQSIKPFLDRNHERALILGTGGAAKAVDHVLKKFGISIFFVTSDPRKKKENDLHYSEITDKVLAACKLVVNCTPLGMYPETERCPDLPYSSFTPEHLAYDLIYNPPETRFLAMAKASGAATVNGLSMLHLQAEKSWEVWNAEKQEGT